MPVDYSLHDNAFGAVLQNEGDISKFMDAFFSFLYRRTDFYVVMKTPNDKMGFPSGIAEKITQSAFKKYAALAAERVHEQEKQRERKEASKQKQICEISVPVVGHAEEVVTSESSSPSGVVSTLPLVDFQQYNNPLVSDSEKVKHVEDSGFVQNSSYRAQPHESFTTDRVEEASAYREVDSSSASQDENDPELAVLQRKFQDNPDSYNGAVRDNYSWSQSITDVDIRVKVPRSIRRSGDVSVEISKKHLKVSLKTAEDKPTEFVMGDLTWDIRTDESMWSLVPGEYVLINLEKVQERWWEAVFTNEPKISVKKIDPSRPVTDLDDEAQAKIEELMYNEHQKRLGLPQSHEKKVHDMLRQAWDVEGSPFKGQPFDPSKVNITPGSL